MGGRRDLRDSKLSALALFSQLCSQSAHAAILCQGFILVEALGLVQVRIV